MKILEFKKPNTSHKTQNYDYYGAPAAESLARIAMLSKRDKDLACRMLWALAQMIQEELEAIHETY